MNVFEAVKQSVTTRQAASFYGIRVGRNGMVCCPFHNDRTPSMKVDSRFYCFGCGASGDVIDFAALLHGLGKREAAVRLAEDFGVSYENPAMRRQIGSVTTGHSPDKISGAEISGNGTVLFPGAMRLSAPAGALENSTRPTAAGCHLASSFCGSVAEDKLHRITFGYLLYGEIEEKRH